jgi:uncharacterized protein YkuJ
MISAISTKTNSYISPKYASKSDTFKCPQCNKEIILCKGDIIKPYFRHKTDIQPCTYYDKPNESQMHKDAKELVRYWLQNKYCVTVTRQCIHCHEKENFEIPEIDEKSNIKLEHRFEYNGSKVADVCYLDEEDIVCIFEIYHTHKTESIHRPGMWFEFHAENLINHDITDNNINLTCIRKVKCEDCIEKENKREERRVKATNILYGWLNHHHLKPFDYFQDNTQYHSTEILKNDYFNIGIYEKCEDDNDDIDARYLIRLCFDDETPDFQDHEHDDIYADETIGIYFVDVDWVCNQKEEPETIRVSSWMDWYINGYERDCQNGGRCKHMFVCCDGLPFRVKYLHSSYIVSVDYYCDNKENSEDIPCILCGELTPLSVMYCTNIIKLYCKNCDIDYFSNKRIYFRIPYSEKDIFKEGGGLWDVDKKLWYCDEDNEYLQDNFKSSILTIREID